MQGKHTLSSISNWIPILWFSSRAYSRIQGKHPTWKLKVLVTIGLKRFSSCARAHTHTHTHTHTQTNTHTHTHTHTHLYGILLFLQSLISSCRFWEHLIMTERETSRYFTFMIFTKTYRDVTNKLWNPRKEF